MTWVQKNAWLFLFIVGLFLLVYAYDNIVVIPQLAPDDPDRGWAWLTRDPEVIEYIKWWFRTFGVWVLMVAMQTLVVSATGYRKGERWAFYSLLFLPALAIFHAFIWPWTIPVQLLLLLLLLAGFTLPFRQFFPRKHSQP